MISNNENIKIRPKHSNKRKTTDEYKKELLDKKLYIEPIEEYINANTKILHKCKLCGHTLYLAPTNVLKCNSDCPICTNKMNRSRDTKCYKKELQMINKNIDVIGEYKNTTTKILHKCKICDHEWLTSPTTIFSGHGCPNCGNKRKNADRQLTHDEYIKRVKENNKYVDVVGSYINMNTKIEHKCKICNNIIMMSPDHVLRGYGCKKCSSKRGSEKLKLTPEQFELNVHNNDTNIIILTQYVDQRTPISCKCAKCNHQWSVKFPWQLYSSHCPKCVAKEKGQKIMLSFNEFKSSIMPNITLLSEYIGVNQKIDCSCDICNHKWTVNQAASLRRSGCPKCAYSKSENMVEEFLDNRKVKYIHPKRFDGLIGVGGGLLSYDFYLPDYNLLIECQGRQHEEAVDYFGGEEQFVKQLEHDRRKREYAKSHNITLIEIWYYDIENTESILSKTLNNLKLESLTTAG